jgi:polysaccharide biosynthesis protein PslH
VKIAFLTSRFPYPPDRGDRLTAFHLLRALAARNAVTLVAFEDGTEPAEARDCVRQMCARIETVKLSRRRSWWQAWTGLFSSVPSQVAYYRSSEMRRTVERVLAEDRYDAVFVQLFRMAPFVRGVTHACKVLFLADSMALNLSRAARFVPLWRRLGLAWECRRVARFEVLAAGEFREAWVVSAVDREDLERRGCANIAEVPHGVDDRLFGVTRMPTSEPRVMFLGNLSVPHNVDAAVYAAREVFPHVRRRVPDAQLWLVGADPAPEVKQLAGLEGVVVTGRVEDLRPLWGAARVMLAPLRFSSGIQNKVLEAMAAGVPVVTTTAVADAMDAGVSDVLIAANGAAALAEAVANVIERPSDFTALAERARTHARAHFTWDALARRIEELAADAKAGS